jgi:hypothetical protein
MKPLVVLLLGAFLVVPVSRSPALAGSAGGVLGGRGQGAPGLQGQPLPGRPFPGQGFHEHAGPSVKRQALPSQPPGQRLDSHSFHAAPHRFDAARDFRHGDRRFFGFGGAVVIVPWWGYPSAYGYPYPAPPTYDDSAPPYSDPVSSALTYGLTLSTPSYWLSITPVPQPAVALPDTGGAVPLPDDPQAEPANCPAAWVEGYYEVRVWPNGQPETFWVPPRWNRVCE